MKKYGVSHSNFYFSMEKERLIVPKSSVHVISMDNLIMTYEL